MVKTRVNSGITTQVRRAFNTAVAQFGRTLTHRKVTRVIDDDGHLVQTSVVNTSFLGDLQYNDALDQRFIEQGIVEVGEGVLYVGATELSTAITPQDLIIDGNDIWEVVDTINEPEIGGRVGAGIVFFQYKCRRRINSSDS